MIFTESKGQDDIDVLRPVFVAHASVGDPRGWRSGSGAVFAVRSDRSTAAAGCRALFVDDVVDLDAVDRARRGPHSGPAATAAG